MKIAVISPYARFEEQLRNIAAEFPEAEVSYFQTDFTVDGYVKKAIDYVSEIEQRGYDAIIARGAVYRAIRPTMNTPVIYAGETLYDTIESLSKVMKQTTKGKRVYLFALEGKITADARFAKILNSVFDIDLVILTYETLEDCKELFKLGLERGSTVVGGEFVGKLCEKYGFEHVRSESGESTLKDALLEAIRIIEIRRREILEKNKIKTILDFSQEGVAYINLDMKIEMFNPTAGRILKMEDDQEQKEKELEPGKLRNLCKFAMETGEAYKDEILTVNNDVKLMCNIVPVIDRGNVNGVTVTFRETVEVMQMENKIRSELARKLPGAKYHFSDIIGVSESIQTCRKLVKQFGKFDSNVLIYGYTGTGKELFAQAIHNESNRKKEWFFAVNCATLPEQLLESELFGYAEGAFTGAKKGGKQGLFELAHGGTLYLDEISEMPMSSQSKLLRVLQEGEIRRIGDDRVLPVDVRIIASSQKNLHLLVRDNNFREDLFYRLNVMNFTVPPLNSRSEDIPHLLEYFLEIYREKFNTDKHIRFESDAMEFLKKYRWRGNVRQLQNFVERIYVFEIFGSVGISQIQELLREFDMPVFPESIGKDIEFSQLKDEQLNGGSLDNLTTNAIKEALIMFNGNKTEAAKYLGVSRTSIWRKLKK